MTLRGRGPSYTGNPDLGSATVSNKETRRERLPRSPSGQKAGGGGQRSVCLQTGDVDTEAVEGTSLAGRTPPDVA